MTRTQLTRMRWGVRVALLLGVAASVGANVLHALPNPISQVIAAWPPLALLLTVELVSRIPVYRQSLAAVRLTATASIACIAAWVSYWHMAGVISRYGEVGAAPYLIPLSVDGLVVVASVCLVELAGRIQLATGEQTPESIPELANESVSESIPEPANGSVGESADDTADEVVTPIADADVAADKSADIPPAAEPDVARPTARTPRKRDAGKAVTKLRARHPDLSTQEIARRVGVTDRTVRRHLSAAA